jgi:hypothetical protein
MPYKYLELQVIVAILEFDYKPNCKTHNFFHIVSKAPKRWVWVVILWLHPFYFGSIQIKVDIVQFFFILLILLYYAKWFPIPTTSKEYQLQVHMIWFLYYKFIFLWQSQVVVHKLKKYQCLVFLATSKVGSFLWIVKFEIYWEFIL